MNQGQFQQMMATLAAGLTLLVPQAAQHVAFALPPGQANMGQPIDYESTVGIKIWQEATHPLSLCFLCEAKEVNPFAKNLLKRSKKMGWDAANVNVIIIDDAAGNSRNVISEYGQLTKAEITFGCAYINVNTCRAQLNIQFYHCLQSSLSKEVQLKIIS